MPHNARHSPKSVQIRERRKESMKEKIEVRKKGVKWNEPGELIETIRRKLRFEEIGNFNPAFCTYKRKRHLVLSKEGDLSDPFRREESYLDSLYIEIGG
jgi:hypothetical protein